MNYITAVKPAFSRVDQTSNHDCGVAALATLLDLDLDNAARLFGRNVDLTHKAMDGKPIGVQPDELQAVLFLLGIPSLQIVPSAAYEEASPWYAEALRHGALAAWSERELTEFLDRQGGTALILTGPADANSKVHWILASNHKILDPNPIEADRHTIGKEMRFYATILIHTPLLELGRLTARNTLGLRPKGAVLQDVASVVAIDAELRGAEVIKGFDGGKLLRGRIFGDRKGRFEDGSVVLTSKILSELPGNVVKTKHSTYRVYYKKEAA